MEHKWLLENFNYAKNLIDEKNLPNCLIITGNKAIGKKDLAEEISKYYLQDDLNLTIDENTNFKVIKAEEGSKIIKVEQIRDFLR